MKTCAGSSGDPVEIAIPDERRPLLALLRTDGTHPDIVEHFIRPMLVALDVPPGKHPGTYVRDLRDKAAEAGDVPVPALQRAAKRFRDERVRDLPWLKDVVPALEEARKSLLINLQPGDPRWAAWIAHDRAQPGKAAYAAFVEKGRTAYAVVTPWPPNSAAVEASGGLWLIPWGTPEHAAHLAAWRREGRAGIERAQAADVPKRQLMERSRWPEIEVSRSTAASAAVMSGM